MKKVFDRIDVTSDITVITAKNINAIKNTGVLSNIFKILSDNSINVDMIAQPALVMPTSCVSFSVSNDDSYRIVKLLSKKENELSDFSLDFFGNKTKLSFFGDDMDTNSGVAYEIFEFLNSCGVSIEMITTSTKDISIVIDSAVMDRVIGEIEKQFNYKIEV